MSELKVDELFEAGSPLGRRLAARHELRTHQQLLAAARREMELMSEVEKVATLNAHPRIGADPALMSEHSRREQGGGQVPELGELNDAYEARFGFRFVVFVNGRARPEIARELRRRLDRSRQEEMREGLQAIVAIAQARLVAPGENS